MRSTLQVILMVVFLAQSTAFSGADERPVFIPNGERAEAYRGHETTPFMGLSQDPIQMVATRMSNDPLAGLEIIGKTSSSFSMVGPNEQPLPFQSQEEVEEFLRTAEIVSKKHIGEGINNPLKVLLEKDGVQMYAVFRDVHVQRSQMKLNDGSTKFFFRDEAIYECAAYELSKLLGLDTVPPTVERRVDRKKGTLQAWIENVTTEKAMRENNEEPPSGGIDRWRWMMQWQTIHLFDNLVYNEDRNRGNVLIESNWKLWMIDHTRAFRRWKELQYPEKVQFLDRVVWERLQILDESEIEERLQDFLSPYELSGLLKRTRLLVDHVKTMIAERGERKVLFTMR
ncbi:MAG: hypothetical protein V3R94_11195 [Acidobacteriota bacterium]